MIRYFLLIFSPIFFCLFSLVFPPSASAIEPAISFSFRLIGDSDRFRLLLDFDRRVSHKVYLLDSPRRLVLDFPLVFFTFGDDAEDYTTSLVDGIRYGAISDSESRLILDLSSSISVSSVSGKALTNSAHTDSHYRLILDGVSSESSIVSPPRYTIVIDPGHGGVDGGATDSTGDTIEKNITLAFSKLLRRKLLKHPIFDVHLTHSDDRFMSLPSRRQVIESHDADLLLSIHADSLPSSDIRGATIYTLSAEGSDDISRTLADDHNSSDLIAGLSLPSADLDTPASDILIDLARRETESFSLRFADLVVSHLSGGDIHLINSPHRHGNFYVLRNPYTPSVLLELGYLSNSDDAALMVMTDWHEKVSDLLVNSILDFFSSRLVSTVADE